MNAHRYSIRSILNPLERRARREQRVGLVRQLRLFILAEYEHVSQPPWHLAVGRELGLRPARVFIQ
jgi:hypothetical protein